MSGWFKFLEPTLSTNLHGVFLKSLKKIPIVHCKVHKEREHKCPTVFFFFHKFFIFILVLYSTQEQNRNCSILVGKRKHVNYPPPGEHRKQKNKQEKRRWRDCDLGETRARRPSAKERASVPGLRIQGTVGGAASQPQTGLQPTRYTKQILGKTSCHRSGMGRSPGEEGTGPVVGLRRCPSSFVGCSGSLGVLLKWVSTCYRCCLLSLTVEPTVVCLLTKLV